MTMNDISVNWCDPDSVGAELPQNDDVEADPQSVQIPPAESFEVLRRASEEELRAQERGEQIDPLESGRAAIAIALTPLCQLEGDQSKGYYISPTIMKGHNKMRIFQEEIFGPVVSVTTFKDQDEALSIANDTLYGLGAGVWSREANTCYRFGRAIKAGRVWTNCYHAYPAHAAFGGYKQSGIGRENHRMMLDHYQQTKNMLVSYSPKKLGFF